MNTTNVILFLFLVVTLSLQNVRASDPNVYQRVDSVMKNWKSTQADFLNDPANAEVLKALRRKAQNGWERDVRALLLKLNDPEMTPKRISEFIKNWGDHGEDIGLSGNPKLILLLETALFQDESASTKKIPAGDEVFRATPVSVRAAFTIREIILNSVVFNQEVVTWAKSLFQIGQKDLNGERQRVRDWFTLNKQAIQAGNYISARPPS